MKKNNFEEYGFKADFEGEIYFKEKRGLYYGLINDSAYIWNELGECRKPYLFMYENQYNLTPIKKEWYEDCILPCAVIDGSGDIELIRGRKYLKGIKDLVRPATKEEILTLLVKED